MTSRATRNGFGTKLPKDGRKSFVEKRIPSCDRRSLLFGWMPLAGSWMITNPADASIGFQKEIKSRRRNTQQELESYFEDAPEVEGLRVRDTTVGVGRQAEAGDSVVVHFDCLYRGLDVASSREARLLGGNRTVSEPYEFVIGDTIEDVLERTTLSGLTSGGGPKPPPALFLATQGMRTGGKRSILVPSQLGYGRQGYLEIPPDATFELQVELLDVR